MALPLLEDYLAGEGIQRGLDQPMPFEMSVRAAKMSLIESGFVSRLVKALSDAGSAYSSEHPELLLQHELADIDLDIKSYSSAVNKAYRKNVILNADYPSEPSDGWVDGTNIYERLNDLLRCRIICKYMDGVPFIDRVLREFSAAEGLNYTSESKATTGGYYAWHCYITVTAPVMKNGKAEQVNIRVEVQIATQLSDIMYVLTHQLYEKRRIANGDTPAKDPTWDSSSPEFRATYLGHGLHLLEGVVQTLKEEVIGRVKDVEDQPADPEPTVDTINTDGK